MHSENPKIMDYIKLNPSFLPPLKFERNIIWFLILINYTIPCLHAQAPNFLWVKQLGGDSSEVSHSLKVDGSGNVYTIGHFEGTVDFDPGPSSFTLTSNGSTDIFVSKLDASGNFIWAKQIGGASYDIGNSLVLDNLSNIYITGYFYNTVDFDPGPSTSTLAAIGQGDIFISKLDASGNLIWAKQMGGSSFDEGNSIALDALGNIYTVGLFETIANFDYGISNFTLTSAGGDEVFVSKLDPSGNFVWAKRLGGSSHDRGYFINVDPSFNVYTTGSFSGIDADFDPGLATYTLSTGGNIDNTFISKLDVTGSFVWAKQISGISNIGTSIINDNSGNVYTIGGFSNTADFDPGAGTYNLTATGANDIFISKLDPSGNFGWAKKIGGSSSDFGGSLTTDASNNIYLTGAFTGTVDFDPGMGIYNLSSAVSLEIFVLILNSSGNFMWVKQLGGAYYYTGGSITLDALNNIYISGAFQNTANFDNGVTNFTLSSAGKYDCFVYKMSPNFLGVKEFALDKPFAVFPNPAVYYLNIKMEQNGFDNSGIEIINSLGQIVLKQLFSNNIDISSLSKGLYYLKVSIPNGEIFVSKFIKE